MQLRKRHWLTTGLLVLNLIAHAHVMQAADNCDGSGSLYDCSVDTSGWSDTNDWDVRDDDHDVHGNGNRISVDVNGQHEGAWRLTLDPVEDGSLYTYATGSLSHTSITVTTTNKDVVLSFSDGALYGDEGNRVICPLYFWTAPAHDPELVPVYYYAAAPDSAGCDNRNPGTGQVLLPSSGLDTLTRLFVGDSVHIPRRQTETIALTRLLVEVAHLTDLAANETVSGTLVVTVARE